MACNHFLQPLHKHIAKASIIPVFISSVRHRFSRSSTVT
ncbi:hypothetical protein B4110_0652 [Parageobacillus toebii]|uniref:Uncharacterized protein n=1 Tax=Parageobacillus toebii TaxID=153151 RepID=A0A150MJL8_9BACL|nr:hypothetical protein B4110_0652 [Parageobacillus toebii]